MDEAIKYISKVEIKGLWGRYDLEWNLHPKVNILSGPNGSGKSTVFRYVYEAATEGFMNIDMPPKIEDFTLTFDNGQTLKLDKDFLYAEQPPTKNKSANLPALKNIKFPHVDFIKPIDNKLLVRETAQKFDGEIKTYLDWLIYLLQKKYLSYQVDLGKRALRLNGNNSEQKSKEISQPRERFIEILNEVSSHTGKYVDDTENEILFCLDDKEISPYHLSSGEKQILIILLTTLVQDQQPYILFMDEPEISIHFDVQKKLISYIRELNPNVQIILATHSPAIIMGGWMDKVKEISDLIVTDNQAVLENAE